ncbi:phosphotransacetylase [Haloechinothrix sp. YIM 98757]|uniref:Phosphotransacetylase n=1 Tax=Haloechinothrix aidingensis TaxID=2752311 RepID=A0A838AF51_9PSEU|nr:phosphotransacetylase [Haloechinothrix aidingensis]MBA0127820.1 phosphotransacetylase [Haloechinothrix aidingensis]
MLAGWCARLAAHRPRVALADGHDARVVTAAAELAAHGITPVVIGTRQEVTSAASAAGVRLGPDIVTMSPCELAACAAGEVLDERLSTAPAERAAEWRADPLFLTVATVPAGLADACVAGSARPTADVLRAALRVVGTAPAASCVTSSFLMVLPGGRRLAYADCAVLPEPDREQLAEVAVATGTTFRSLTGEEPAVAMLSFSTKGSASHAGADLVRAATERVREREPGLDVDGELQFDAAFIESVGRSKAGASTVAGRANVFVFPNLAAGNIGYKITQRLAGAQAYGPILQGLAMPVNDLSRGCSSADIVTVAAISALQSSAPAMRSAEPPLSVTARTGRQ